MYQLLIEKQVEKQLKNIPKPDYQRIKEAILKLANDPYPVGTKKLRGRPGYRIRQGDYRIIYDVNEQILTVYVLSAGHRKDIYEG
jgi:mRNA interferase RelE/StbE